LIDIFVTSLLHALSCLSFVSNHVKNSTIDAATTQNN